MQPLATSFTEGAFVYTQVERSGAWAIFSQQHHAAQTARFEVVHIRVQPPHTWPNGSTSPEREVYPGASRWGVDGYTVYSLQTAHDLVAQLRRET